MKLLRELIALLLVNLSGITQRLGSALTIVVGVTCAVGVLVSMLAMGTGAREQQTANVRSDRVVLTSRGTMQGQGSITKQEAAVILGLPGVRKDAKGNPIVVFESMVPIEGQRRSTGKRIYFPLVGVSARPSELASDLRFTAGRPFRPGGRFPAHDRRAPPVRAGRTSGQGAPCDEPGPPSRPFSQVLR